MPLGVESISSIGRVWFCLFGVVLSNVSMALLVYFSNSSSYFDFFRALVVGGLEMETQLYSSCFASHWFSRCGLALNLYVHLCLNVCISIFVQNGPVLHEKGRKFGMHSLFIS